MTTDPTTRRRHWDRTYRTRVADERSWFQPEPALSVERIVATGAGPRARIVDVGGGASLLVDHLLDAGYRCVTVLDVSTVALEESRRRLGERASEVRWLEADITAADIEGPFDVWHDRAVFHFLVDPEDRRRYLRTMGRCVPPGGHTVIATFAEDGPARCSGLPVMRYGPDALARTVGEGWTLVDARRELHATPSGSGQAFVYGTFRRM